MMYVGMAIVFLIMIVTGVLSYMQSKGLASFYVAARSGRWYLIAGSLFASGVSGATFLGVMAWFYELGAGTMWIPAGIAWSYFVLCFLIGPKLRRFGQLTISDYLAERFDSPLLRPVFSIIVSVWMVILLGSLYVQGGLLFSQMFGMSYAQSTFITAAFVVIFTVFGGMVIILKTDFIGTFIIIGSLIITMPYLIQASDGWEAVTTSIQLESPNYFTSTGELTALMAFSWFFIWLFGYLGNPGYLTRFYSAVNEREIIKAGIAIAVIYLPALTLFFISAIYARSLFPSIEDPELLWIAYTMEYAPPIVIGMAMSGMFMAVMTSATSWLLAGASSLGRDIYQKIIHRNVSEERMLIVTKLLVLVLAALSVPIGIARPAYIMEMMNLAYLIAGSAGGLVILLSMFYRNMTKEAAWAGIISGAFIAIGASILQNIGIWPASIDPMIPTVITAFLIILIVSRLTKPNHKMLSVYDRMNVRESSASSSSRNSSISVE
ncbi:sodium:solute symporter [Geomicrobium sp. JCM 19055]|uniref:sodium:solute symporter family protein n=1 Tax=Geomicrobium sp. JCM 19055 TaxID=1460649 RepID=UPI00045ED60B|nr:hypothetical protein [Geomicrobium sp. JCM 19055]GAJ97419.1 hypothetical protein JCM19055_277 [Geomicrobium sp. JCM 19055]